MEKKFFLKRTFHRDWWRFAIFFNFFEYDDNIRSVIRSVPNTVYSNTHKCWYTDDNEESLQKIIQLFKGIADVDISALTSEKKPEVPPGITSARSY